MPDVNVLVYAHRAETRDHLRYAKWIEALATGPEPFALSEAVLHGFLRIVTNQRIFNPPSTMAQAYRFVDSLLARPQCAVLRPGPQHWQIFRDLTNRPRISGKLVADAAHAATAVENGCEWVSADTDFALFVPPLRWQHL